MLGRSKREWTLFGLALTLKRTWAYMNIYERILQAVIPEIIAAAGQHRLMLASRTCWLRVAPLARQSSPQDKSQWKTNMAEYDSHAISYINVYVFTWVCILVCFYLMTQIQPDLWIPGLAVWLWFMTLQKIATEDCHIATNSNAKDLSCPTSGSARTRLLHRYMVSRVCSTCLRSEEHVTQIDRSMIFPTSRSFWNTALDNLQNTSWSKLQP